MNGFSAGNKQWNFNKKMRCYNHYKEKRKNRNKITSKLFAYKLIVATIILFVLVLQIIDLDKEYVHISWTMQQDEKLVVPDARAFYLDNQKITDYKMPISSCFGIGGPILAYFGFKIAGMNNYGLRLPYVFISCAALFFLSFAMLNLIPSVFGFIGSLIMILNYNFIAFGRYAIAENILVLMLASIFYLYSKDCAKLLRYSYFIIGIGSILVFFKIIFPLPIYLLLVLITLLEKKNYKQMFKLTIIAGASFVIMLSIHYYILWLIGIHEEYTQNIIYTFFKHIGSGKELPLLQNFSATPLLYMVPTFLGIMLEWHYLQKLIDWMGTDVRTIFMLTTSLTLVAFTVLLWFKGKISNATRVVGLFIIVNLVFFSFFFFYWKRAVFLFPFTLIFIMLLMRDIKVIMQSYHLQIKVIKCVAIVILCGVLMGQLGFQFYQVKYGLIKLRSDTLIRSNRTNEDARKLEKIISKSDTIFMHCYAFRYLWQTRRRIISADDQWWNNQRVLDKAINEKGEYLMLSSRGGTYKLPATHRLQKIKRFISTLADTGSFEDFNLYSIKEK